MSNQLWRNRLTAALVAAVVPFAISATAAEAAPSAQVQLATAAKKAPSRKVTAIVQFKPSVSEARVAKVVAGHGGKVTSRIPFVHGVAVKLPAKQAKALAADRRVVGLTLNSRVHSTGLDASKLATAYPRTTRADKLWQRGITGRGVGVAVIDTGIAAAPDFAGRIVANVVTSPTAQTATDGFGHGTHVAGIIAGNSFARATNDPFYGKYVGMAPEANLIAVKAADEAEFNIRVLNLSLATDTPQSYKTDPLDAAVEYAWQKGIVVVAAAGNRGTAADAVQYAPANDPYVISVGGEDESADYGRGARADWSSTGLTQDGLSKPDVMAPGAHMVSVLASGSAFQALCPACSIGGAYFKAGGTSMAAPVVAGAAALLLQARPTLTPDQVKTLLTATDKPIKGTNGAGLIDVERATFTPVTYLPSVNRYNLPNVLIAALNRTGTDVAGWTKSSWTAASGALSADWAKSSWTCTCAATGLGTAIDPQRSSWSRSSWSSAGEDASVEAAQYAADAAQDTGTLDAPIPVDAAIPTDDPAVTQ
jgi:serine protease AprX